MFYVEKKGIGFHAVSQRRLFFFFVTFGSEEVVVGIQKCKPIWRRTTTGDERV